MATDPRDHHHEVAGERIGSDLNEGRAEGGGRRFDRRALLAAGAAATAATAAHAAGNQTEPGAEVRVGCLNVKAYSHLASHWGALINSDNTTAKLTGMKITHCWDVDPAGAAAFAKRFHCQAVKRYDDMLGKVDAVISGGYYNHPWNHVLHDPYLRAGIPNLINRPFSNSVAKARQMIELARKSGASILVPSAFEHNYDIVAARQWARGKKITSYSATNGAEDYPTHGIHGVYMVYRAVVEAGNPVVAVSYRTPLWHRGPGIMTIEHRATDGRTFYGALHQTGGWGTIRIDVDGAPPRDFAIEPGTVPPYNRTQVWAPTLWAFETMARGAKMPQSLDQLLEKNRLFLAGWYSVLKCEGNRVALNDVPEEWEAPVELPNRPGDPTVGQFRKLFG